MAISDGNSFHLLTFSLRQTTRSRDTPVTSGASEPIAVSNCLSPETYNQILTIARQPATSVTLLCQFLNGEATLSGLGVAAPSYMTALGDVFWTEPLTNGGAASLAIEQKAIEQKSLKLAGSITVDFLSQNTWRARATSGLPMDSFTEFSEDELRSVYDRLAAALEGIKQVSIPAYDLIRKYVRVIVPQNVEEGFGSTSQNRFPGRVLLRGVQRMPLAAVASSLVHEAIHQLIYVIEGAGEFVNREARGTVRSPWTGRDLPLHSFIHACFVWYGLSHFWSIDEAASAFPAQDVSKELFRAANGFQAMNPVNELKQHAGMIRGDVLRVAEGLQESVQRCASHSFLSLSQHGAEAK